jgi:hypothetical protein
VRSRVTRHISRLLCPEANFVLSATQATLLCWSLVLLSILNAFWLFTNRRRYKLFLQEVGMRSLCPCFINSMLMCMTCSQGSVNSPNAKRVVLSTPTQTGDDQTSNDNEEFTSLLRRISYVHSCSTYSTPLQSDIAPAQKMGLGTCVWPENEAQPARSTGTIGMDTA